MYIVKVKVEKLKPRCIKLKMNNFYFCFQSLLSSLCLLRFHESFIAAYVNSRDMEVCAFVCSAVLTYMTQEM